MEKHEFVMKVMAYGKTVTIAQVEDAVDIHEFLDMSRGLSVFPRVTSIFTRNAISPSSWWRQRSSRYAIRGRRKLEGFIP